MKNIPKVLAKSFELTGITFTSETLQRTVEQDPTYPSLYTITNTLDAYNISNKAIQVKSSQIDNVPLPCFVLFNTENGYNDFVLLTEVSEDRVCYYDGNTKQEKKDSFLLKMVDGVLVLQEPQAHSGELYYEDNLKEYSKKRLNKIVNYGSLFFFTLLVIYLLIQKGAVFPQLLFTSLAVSGLIVSILLYHVQLDSHAPWAKKVCGEGEKQSCSAVLNSEYSHIFGISLTDIGFCYFIFLTIFSFPIFAPFAEKLFLISLLCATVSTFIPYSLYVQYKILNRFCRLCLIVQFIFLLLLGWTLSYGSFFPDITNNAILSLAISFFAALSLTIFMKNALQDKFYKQELENVQNGLLRDTRIFELLQKDETPIPQGWQQLALGDEINEDLNLVLQVSTPMCKHCRNAFTDIEKLTHKFEHFQTLVIFNVPSNLEDKEILALLHILALQKEGRKKEVLQALAFCYKDFDEAGKLIQKQFPLQQPTDWSAEKEHLSKMRKWCQQHQLFEKPVLFLNEAKVPKLYSPSMFHLIS